VKTKISTIGVDPKVPVQALSTLVIIFVAGLFAVDLDPEVAGAIAVVLGALIGTRAPAPKTEVVPSARSIGRS
jgi:hypothetical protein